MPTPPADRAFPKGTSRPTGNLDSTNGAQIMNLLSELNEAGTTIVMVTHSPADAEYSARTIHLFDGKVVSENFIEQEYAAHPAR